MSNTILFVAVLLLALAVPSFSKAKKFRGGSGTRLQQITGKFLL